MFLCRVCSVLLPKVMIPTSYTSVLGHRVHIECFELQVVPKMHHQFPSLCLQEVYSWLAFRLLAIRVCPEEKLALAGRLSVGHLAWAVCKSNGDRWNPTTHLQFKYKPEYLTIDIRNILQIWKESCIRIQNV